MPEEIPSQPDEPPGQLEAAAQSLHAEMIDLLQESIRLASPSGREGEFVRFLERWARDHGLITDLWEADEAALAAFPEGRARHLPLAGRPTLVVKLPGRPGGATDGLPGDLILNAHADTVPGEASGDLSADGARVMGRGACDDKGPLVGALWAMAALQRVRPQGLAADLVLEIVPGEEDAVGLGTLTSLVRGYRGSGVVILEPTENMPRSASRGGLRFEVVATGRAVHGTVKWLGRDAIGSIRRVLAALDELEARWNDRQADALFTPYPIMRPVTVDTVEGGRWQGMVCDRCRAAGYLELLPGDNLAEWRVRFERELKDLLPREALHVTFTEEYSGHRTPPDDPLCVAARQAVDIIAHQGQAVSWPGWSAFNSGCEAGLRFREQQTPTLVWGPGSLAQAHAAEEYVEGGDVAMFAAMLSQFAMNYLEG
jgi:acetylornithine deacetylase